MFRDLSCIQCHRFGTEGGSLGPDLGSVAHRFGRRDLLEAILVPQKAVSDQYTLVPMPSGLLDTATAEELTALIHYLEAGPPADS
ncbi:MAG: c-type cytochrome [Planctomycetota bacterium]